MSELFDLFPQLNEQFFTNLTIFFLSVLLLKILQIVLNLQLLPIDLTDRGTPLIDLSQDRHQGLIFNACYYFFECSF